MPTPAITRPDTPAAFRPAGAVFRLVVVESPYAGNVELNMHYLRACMADCLARGEAPFASHGLYTQAGVLDDTIPEERAKGMAAGFAWNTVAHATVVYTDRGISGGMRAGIKNAEMAGRPIEYRKLPEEKWVAVCLWGNRQRALGAPVCSECGCRLLNAGAPRCVKCPAPADPR